MHWLSKSAEQFIGMCGSSTAQHTRDVVVIGSGYGAATAALRFAEHGLKVAVLERGKEYVAGEFPNDVSQAGRHVRSEIATTAGVTTQGYEDSLFDFRIGLRAGALIGNGLGGGSLINAGVGLQPDARVFKQAEWPAALRHENLNVWFKQARHMHELQTAGSPGVGKTQPLNMTKTSKFKSLKDLQARAPSGCKQAAGDTDVTCTFEAAPIAVQLDSPVPQENGPRDTCTGCGDCATGCNYNAKLTLTATYLPQAVKAGAEIFTGLTVLHVTFEPAGDQHHPWVVHFIRTTERKLQHDIAKNSDLTVAKNLAADPAQWLYKVRARRVVVSAGTFGSTEILLRSRAKGLSLSTTALGVGVSGNGDDVAYGYDMKGEANATGWGSQPMPSKKPEQVVGPTITGIIRFTDKADVKRSTLIQDGAVPGLISGAVNELLTTLATVAQLDKFSFRRLDGKDPLAIQPLALKRSLTLLGMGHDSASGSIEYDLTSDRTAWAWPAAAEEKTPWLHRSRMRGLVQKLGGLYLQNPAAGLLPQGLSAAQSGPQAGGLVFTVHPLGGCRMGDTVHTSVVNHWGCAWTAEGSLHDGLFVMDGSMVPGSLGANPMLTITALAERSCSLILQGINKQSQPVVALPCYPAAVKPLKMNAKPHSSTRLAEVLRGQLDVVQPVALGLAVNAASSKSSAALFLQFDVNDWQGLLENKNHVVGISASRDSSYKQSKLVIDQWAAAPLELTVTGGTVNLFYQPEHRWWTNANRYCRTVATFFISHWWPEYRKNKTIAKLGSICEKASKSGAKPIHSFLTRWTEKLKKRARKFRQFLLNVGGALLLARHANEVRAFDYSMHLVNLATPEKTYILTGRKTILAAASWGAICQQVSTPGWQLLERRSIWQQMTELDVKLYEGAHANEIALVASGRLVMDLPDMLRRVVPEVKTRGDSLNALLELSGYPLLILRAILKTRIFDLKLPDYPLDACGKNALPDTDPALTSKPPGYFELNELMYSSLTLASGQKIKPHVTKLEVPPTWLTSGSQKDEKIRLGLVRYRPDTMAVKSIKDGAHKAVHKAKSIILMNGFDLSAKPFVAQELNEHGGNLATNFVNAGWDVWLFEYRASPLLDASARTSTMDDIAAFDIPAAVDHILATVSSELKTPVDQTQIFAFTHCVGSASMAMSLLGGYLKRKSGIPKLAGLSLSQFHTQVVGSATAQMRLQLAALLSNVLKIETLQFTANTVKADLLYSMFDRLFATSRYWQTGSAPAYAHQVYNQCCPGDSDLRKLQPDSATCKRMTGLLSRLFEHDQLLDATHAKLGDYFGRSNLGVYMQGAKCTEYERLVNADGQNVYVTDGNVRDHLRIPLLLIHGAKNVLFDKESATRSWDELQRIRSTCMDTALDKLLILPHYAHFDCTIGKTAALDIFQPTVAFFNNAFEHNAAASNATDFAALHYTAMLPRTGPIVGWVRPGTGDTTLIRVWMEVDTTDAQEPIEVLSFISHANTGNAPIVQSWPVQLEKLSSAFYVPKTAQSNPYHHKLSASPTVSYSVADLEIPNAYLDHVRIEMVSIHAWTAQGVPPSVLTQNNIDPLMLINDLKQRLDIANSITRRADPDTLSRRRKTLRGYSDRIIHLQKSQLQTHVGGDLHFISGGCRHPGLTGFERTRADSTLKEMVGRFTMTTPNPVGVQTGSPSTNGACYFSATPPAFMLMLGDQIYADARAGVMDTQSPIEKLLPRYRGAFAGSTGFRKLAQHMPMYMVMDDHEINDDWSQEQALAGSASKVLAANAGEAFKIFQYAHSPGFPAAVVIGASASTTHVEGFNYSYQQRGIGFLVLDTRTQRTRVPKRRLLHPSQWLWLEQWLLAEHAKGKQPKFVVSGSVLAPGLKEYSGLVSPRDADTWQLSGHERKRMLSFIADNHIENVVFLSSDYHCSAAATIRFTHSAVKAWAIVAPSLHAPLRFANVHSADVCDHEVIALNNGEALIDSQAFDGEGWLDCCIKQTSHGGFCLDLTFNLRQLDEQNWPANARTVHWDF